MKTTNSNSRHKFAEMLGNSILFASIQASIGSVELSSKYSVVNFSKDQETLQAASDALTGYLIIAFIWTIGSAMISYGQYGIPGLITSLVANIVLVGWIFFSYLHCFKTAARRYNLQFPTLFRIGLDMGNDVPIYDCKLKCPTTQNEQ
jgi:hypothetical protein